MWWGGYGWRLAGLVIITVPMVLCFASMLRMKSGAGGTCGCGWHRSDGNETDGPGG